MIRARSIRGFTIVEAAMSMIVVSLMLAAAMGVSASVARLHAADGELSTAIVLADALADEIRDRSYREPGSVSDTIGLDAGEISGDHAAYDDVDDYHGLVESTLTDRSGEKIQGIANWERRVTVEWVTLSDTRAG